MRPFPQKTEQKTDTKAQFWFGEIDRYEKDFGSWQDRAKKICERYKIEEKGAKKSKNTGFNILWSNVQTLLPAAYDSPPNPNVTSKFGGDKAAKQGAIVLERSVSHFVKTDDFNDSMGQCVLDRLLGGRGIVWVRYEPKFSEPSVLQGDVTTGVQVTDDIVPDIEGENVVIEYVNYCDFGHTFARTWQEVRGVWRKAYLTRRQLTARFGKDLADRMPMEGGNKEAGATGKMQCVYEIWDSEKKEVIWLARGFEQALDVKPDPLRLQKFFPCPRPLYATLDNSNLIPSPDFIQYQEQALELDMITQRIGLLLKALRVAGVYDRSAEGVQRLLTETSENKLIPVENWAMFSEKGGLNGVVNWFPLDAVVSTLQSLYQARDRVKNDVYEITGMSDIIRGASNAQESATAQKIKGQYASLRMGRLQRDVERFCRDLVRIIGEIIAEHFEPETIKMLSGLELPDQQMQQQAAMAQQQGIEVPQQVQELLQKPTWEQVLATIKNDAQRCYRIDIETDSTIKADQEAEKAARIEFITAVGGFLRESASAPAELQPLLLKMLEFGAGAFKIGRDLQDDITQFGEDLKAKAATPPEAPQENPAIAMQQAEAQAKQQQEMAKLQLEQAKMEASAQEAAANRALEEQKLQIEVERLQKEFELKDRELAIREIEAQNNLQIEMARIQADVMRQEQPPIMEESLISEA